MDMKADIGAPAPVRPVPQAEAVASPREKSAAAQRENSEDASRALAAIQETLRKALNVEPVRERELQIRFEKELNIYVAKIFDKESGELIRQIPMPEEISVAKRIREAIRKMAGSQSGIAVDQEV